jgi:mRNA interferase MazF
VGGAMKRSEVRWYRFPKPDKRRPVVILTRDSVLEYLGEVAVAPISSTIRDGMPHDCVVDCDRPQTVSQGRIDALITRLGAEKMREISRAIRFALDL